MTLRRIERINPVFELSAMGLIDSVESDAKYCGNRASWWSVRSAPPTYSLRGTPSRSTRGRLGKMGV